MQLQFFLVYAVILFLNWQQELLGLPEKLNPVQNLTGCGSPDVSIKMDKLQLLVRETINPYLNKRYGPVCGCGGPSWTTIVDLDMSDTSQNCPTSNWRLINSGSVRACGRMGLGCSSNFFSSGGVTYSQVCGQFLSVQFGRPDGLTGFSRGVDSNYVDGISLTHGSSPRKHIWTFAGIDSEHLQYHHPNCLCTHRNRNLTDSPIPSWILNNYFCDTASNESANPRMYLPENPLWDGQGCSSVSSCCIKNNPPWFCASLPSPTSDNLEVRICGNGDISNEDVVITRMQIYVK